MRIDLVLARTAAAAGLALCALVSAPPTAARADGAAPAAASGPLGAAKAAREAREEAAHAAAPAAPKHPGFYLQPAGAAAIPWRSGIIESGLAPLPAAVYDIANQWHGNLAGRHVIVYAGALRRQPAQGVLVVVSLSLDGSASGAPQTVALPLGSGPARIASASGASLTVATASGRTLPFRVPTNQPLLRAR